MEDHIQKSDSSMPDKPSDPASSETQKTKRGHEIPVPKRGDFLRDLEKAAEPHEGNGDASDASESGERD
jgi:hypothetical protein